MIQKISSNEYLKRFDKMTAAEKRSMIDRVGQWLRGAGRTLKVREVDPMARLQNVMQVSLGWNDVECQAWMEGVKLLTAFVTIKDTWLPDMIYNMAAKRGIKKIHNVLSEVMADKDLVSGPVPKNTENKAAFKPVKEEHAEGTKSVTHAVADRAAVKDPKSAEEHIVSMQYSKLAVVRPKHIDQYAHLLPKKTQEKAATIRGLLRDLDTARENMRKLMEAGDNSADKTAQWARTAAKIDEKVKKIYMEIDAEWEKLVNTGKVKVDAVGNVSVTDSAVSQSQHTEPEKPELTSEQKHRRRDLRKWLIDTRRGAEGKAREKRIEQWKVNIREYLTLEPAEAALKDKKIVAAAKHYGVKIEELKN
ncbi:MAG: hypothetical protein IK144_12145 [Bacteroidaceae bacterium]|nr:hypothetical protein [Bacteroidaceae bacterium]